MPELKDKSTLTRLVLGGWQANGIIQAQTGFPFTVSDSVNTIRYLTNRPNVTCDPNDGPQTVAQYFDTSCFTRRSIAQTASGESNQGRNTVRGPGFSRVDASLFKNFAIRRSHELQLRVEAFNLFNQTRFGQPISAITSTATFGAITSADDGRIVQLGVKYTF